MYDTSMRQLQRILRILMVSAMALSQCPPVYAQRVPTLSFSAAFTNPGLLSTSSTDNSLYEYQGAAEASVTAWKNDTVYLKIAVSGYADTSLIADHSSFHSDSGQEISADCMKITLLKETSASLGIGLDPAIPHEMVSDIITDSARFSLNKNQLRCLWVSISVPAQAQAGQYQAAITLRDIGLSEYASVLTVDLTVRDLTLDSDDGLSLNLWQYPYASLRYYDILAEEEPFSQTHLAVLKKEMELYHELGGEAITASIINEPWGHQTYDDYPAMIRWNRDEQNQLTFDYTAFDAWVSLCMSCGIDQQIDSFSILPFSSSLTVYQADGSSEQLQLEVGSAAWTDAWTAFLTSYIAHLEEKGWFDITDIFIDERDTAQVQAAIALIRSIHGKNGKSLKIASAVNAMPDNQDLSDQIDYLAIGIAAVTNQSSFDSFLSHRHQLGLTTVMYNCSTNYPNSFAISNPDESIWSMEYLAARGFDGYLRWAYDAWNEDPLNSLDYRSFEAGDILLAYPDQAAAADPSPQPSVRLEMIAYGMRNVAKYRYLLNHLKDSATAESLQNGWQAIKRAPGNFNAYGSMTAAYPSASTLTSQEVQRLAELLDAAAAQCEAEN